MKTILHRAESRGFFDHGWLKTHHTFSFADYYNTQRINFGALRVLNDDRIEGGTGFDLHPHQNMEVISIPLKGDLEHQDSLGHKDTIQEGEIQVMSAGTGIMHSEYNRSSCRYGYSRTRKTFRPDTRTPLFPIWYNATRSVKLYLPTPGTPKDYGYINRLGSPSAIWTKTYCKATK